MMPVASDTNQPMYRAVPDNNDLSVLNGGGRPLCGGIRRVPGREASTGSDDAGRTTASGAAWTMLAFSLSMRGEPGPCYSRSALPETFFELAQAPGWGDNGVVQVSALSPGSAT
jgi:hypothetical protein